MEGLGVLLVVVAAFIANLPALREQWRTDRAGSFKTIWLFGVYLLNIGLGIVVVLLLAPRESAFSPMFAECSWQERVSWLEWNLRL